MSDHPKRWVRAPALTGTTPCKRIALVRMNYFPEEAHVRKNAEALTEAGYAVDVICLRDKGEPARDEHKGVRIHRLPLMHKRTSKLRYVFEYAAFFVMASWLLTWLHIRRRYDIVEVYNVPDIVVLVAMLPRLLGAKVVLYMFEATPEMYIDRFELKPGGLAEKLLRWQERISVRFAHRSIVEGPHEREMRGERGVDMRKIGVVMNVPEPHLFKASAVGANGIRPAGAPTGETLPNEVTTPAVGANGVRPTGGGEGIPPVGQARSQSARPGSPDWRVRAVDIPPFEIITHGSLLKRYGIQTLIEAIPLIRAEIPSLKVWVVGDGEYRDDLEALARETGVAGCVEFTGWIKHEQVSGYIDRCAVGVVPMLYNQLPNKLFEYVAMGRPTVVGDVPSIRRAFAEHEVLYYDTGDAKQLAEGVIHIFRHPKEATEMAARAHNTFQKYTWDVMRDVYVGLHDELLVSPPSREPIEAGETAR